MTTPNWRAVPETENQPKMLEVYLEQVWQHAFCYACAVGEPEYDWQDPRLLLAIIAGNDSTVQAMKAAVDLGSNVYFGHGIKEMTGYRFVSEFRILAEKGKYTTFPMSINSNRKAIVIVHDDLLTGGRYFLSFNGDPAEDLRLLLGGPPFGLHILPQWKHIIFREFISRGVIEEVEFYYDECLFPHGFSIYKLNTSEDEETAETEIDNLISDLIRAGSLPFPEKGDGTALEGIEDLTSYMETFVDDMIHKVTERDKIQPLHDPMKDEVHSRVKEYRRELFPVQAHVSTAMAKSLDKQKSVIIQGEMSSGKSSMMTAAGDIWATMSNKKGYFACVMCPPSLTKKWPEEIHELLPQAEVKVIERTEQLIKFHTDWLKRGKPKPQRPTFFVISFTTMRSDSAIVPAVKFQQKRTIKQLERKEKPYRYGYYCPDCGRPLQVVEEKKMEINDDGEEEEVIITRTMEEDEFGTTRRLHNGKKPANAFCYYCGSSLWTRKTPTRYASFRDWAQFDRKLTEAIKDGNKRLAQQIVLSQPDIPKKVGQPRRVSAGEYMRRRMKRFFDFAIIDEIHQLKGGLTAQGISAASLVSASKKVIGGTGTLFGGKAEDIYFILWRLFPGLMVKNGYQYSELRKWNEEYGNIETTIYSRVDRGEYSNRQSRGGIRKSEKVLPGISPYVFSKFLIQNTVNVRLKDVWLDPVEFVDVPTILVDLDEDLRGLYEEMKYAFETAIQNREDGYKLYLPLTQTGIAYPDNPFTYPAFSIKTEGGKRELIWEPRPFPADRILNKERKLQEIVQGEIAEGRKCIVYVRDTGSSVEGRDVRPRIKKILEMVGAKVCILDTGTTATNKRSEWLEQKILREGYDVCIVSQELVQVGLDLICTPTLIFYQFNWSLFVHNQAARRAWRIGQDKECRNYYLAYRDTYQEYMATLIAQKNKAASIMNGDVSSEGINAMLGDDGDLQTLLVNAIKKGEVLKGSTEEWVAAASDRAREILANIGKKKEQPSLKDQFIAWINEVISIDSVKNKLIRKAGTISKQIELGNIPGFYYKNNVLEVDAIEAFGFDIHFISDGEIAAFFKDYIRDEQIVVDIVVEKTELKRKRKSDPVDGQLAFKLF